LTGSLKIRSLPAIESECEGGSPR